MNDTTESIQYPIIYACYSMPAVVIQVSINFSKVPDMRRSSSHLQYLSL